jgi:hypothetical protein
MVAINGINILIINSNDLDRALAIEMEKIPDRHYRIKEDMLTLLISEY